MDDATFEHDSMRIARADWPGWSTFLASSWTWCIGMFLPVLLVRDFGIWGWIVFAVPNVVGAAAMGWVLKREQSSFDLVAGHRQACSMFSGVTIAFHMYFVISVLGPLATSVTSKQAMDLALGSVFVASILMYLLMTRQRGAERVLAAITLLVSIVMMLGVSREIWRAPELAPRLSRALSVELLWLAPVCFFGFGCCPYLDLTFHRARQHTAAPRAAFGVGFGALFLLMIVFTLMYSSVFYVRMPTLLAQLLLIHMVVQTSFTVAAHARELRRRGARAAIVAAALTGAAWIFFWLLDRNDVVNGLAHDELIYRIFMGFYGLVFPAYVWLVILPGDRPTQRNLLVYAVAVVVALPMFWMGFVMIGQMIWLVPGLAVVLLARLLCQCVTLRDPLR